MLIKFWTHEEIQQQNENYLRDHFAGLAMTQFIGFGTKSDDEYFELGARAAYKMADAMLKAREAE